MTEQQLIFRCEAPDDILTALRSEAKRRGVPHSELADILGVSQVTVTRILGAKQTLTLENLYRLLSHLGVGVALTPPKAAPNAPLPDKRRQRKQPVDKGVSIADLVAAGKLSVGDILEPVDDRWEAVAEVGLGGVLILEDGRETSPSTAAKIVRGTTTNGWSFWGLDGKSLDKMRDELLSNSGDFPA